MMPVVFSVNYLIVEIFGELLQFTYRTASRISYFVYQVFQKGNPMTRIL